MTLAINIRNARAAKKLTRKQLAELAGVSTDYIITLETRGYEPKIALLDIARVLGVSVEVLLKKE